MTEALPIGIIRNTDNISSDIEAIDRVDVEDLAQLWRVYSTNRVLLPHDAGRRLENLFWRILSNARIHQSIRGSTIARLFLHISEGSDFLRTTPTQSPRGNRSGDSGRLSPSPTPPRVTIQEDHVGATRADSDLEIRRTTRQPSDPSRQALPPPILKKPRAGSDEPPKTARIISPTQTCFDYSWSPAARKTPTSPPPVAESSGAGKNNGKKKTSFTASTVTSRRRPAVTKRKSSQSSTGSSMASPRLQAETAAPFRPELSPRLQEETAAPFQPDPSLTSPVVAPTQALRGTGTAPAAVRHVFSLSPPAESWQDVESSDISSFRMPSVDESTVAQSFTGDQPTDWLVDKDFRSRFVDRQRQILSDINLSRMNPDGSGTGAIQGGPGKEKGKEKLRQSSLGGSGQSKPSFASKAAVPDAGEDDDDDEEDEDEDEEGEEDEDDDKGEDEDEDEEEGPALPLPRTKSQLSLMIERERRASADNGKGKAKEQPRKTSS